MGEDPGGADDAAEELRYHVDGEIVPASQATVSVEDRGFAYGDAAFETLRAYGGEVFRSGRPRRATRGHLRDARARPRALRDRPESPDRRDARRERPR